MRRIIKAWDVEIIDFEKKTPYDDIFSNNQSFLSLIRYICYKMYFQLFDCSKEKTLVKFYANGQNLHCKGLTNCTPKLVVSLCTNDYRFQIL